MMYFLILVSLVLLLCHVYIYHSRRGKLTNRLPGPRTLPIIGNTLDFIYLSTGEIYTLMRKWGKNYYPIYKLWILNKLLINIRHPDDLEVLLTSKKYINKVFAYENLSIWLKSGLLLSSGEKWHHRRKILTPAFHFNVLKRHVSIINKNGVNIINNKREEGLETTVDVIPFCMKFTLNVICESSMGVSLDGDIDKETMIKYHKALGDMVDLIIYRNVRPYLKDWALPLAPRVYKRIKNSVNVIDNFTNEIVEQRRKYHNTNYESLEKLQNDSGEFENGHYESKKKRLAMLDLLLTAEKDNLIDHEGIKEEVSTFVFEGHDTTGMTLTFIILLLAEHEDVQSKARKEVKEIFDRVGGKLDISDLNDMVYLERVIKESLRLYPPVPTFTRHMTDDLQLPNGLAPKGSDILVHIVDVHRDSKFWPNPEKFDPDRFLPVAVAKRNSFAYIPFSAGSRNCIGQKFAMMELKIFISLVLHHFYLEPIDHLRDVEIVADVITRPSRPMQTKFIRIDRHS